MELLINTNFVNGWGDTTQGLFNVINLVNFIKKNYIDIKIIFLINDYHNAGTLDKVINLKYFNDLIDDFKILKKEESFKFIEGIGQYEGNKYIRIYSGFNDNIKNNIPGNPDVFSNEKYLNETLNLNIPFHNYSFQTYDDRVVDYPIFNTDIVDKAKKFVKENFDEDFETIFYRSLNPLNNESIEKFKNKLKDITKKDKKYFMCSNSAMVKKIIKDEGTNVIFFRDLENHSMSHIPLGGTLFNQKDDDVFFPVTEMIIMGESSKILYQGEINMVSLFNWYAISVKKVKLIEL